ncbi:MAG: amidohydrolase family protein [Gemmatimonadota bacterium]|nr:amidohydrolase family protein [Gemmatimonadota bacterium]
MLLRHVNRPPVLVCLVTFLLAAAASPQEAAPPQGADETPSLPLEGSTGKLSFTTDEGTWLSLDITPDGQSIILEHLGDFYRLPISGGRAERIFGGLAYESQPRVSPDGQWLAFTSDRDGAINLGVSKTDGTDARKLTSESSGQLVSPDWTTDGQYVIVTDALKEDALMMFHRDGGKGVRLGPEPAGTSEGDGQGRGLRGVGVHAAPDGRHLYLAVPAAGIDVPAPQLSQIEIGRIDLLTGEANQVTQTVRGAVRPAVSPDGRSLVYATLEETETVLRLRDLVTDTDRRLFGPVENASVGSGRTPSRDHFPGYAFTPDGQAIVVSSGGRLVRVDVRTGAVSAIPFQVDVDLDIGPELTAPYRVEEGPVRARLAQDPQFSPGGRRVAASVLTRIYVMDVENPSSPEQLTRDDAREFKPVWSPDGAWIAYVTWAPDTGGHIWRMPADGSGQPQRLTQDPGFYTELAFSPDGDRIVALRGSRYLRGQSYSEVYSLVVPVNLVWLPAAGGDTTVITPGNGLRRPHVTNDTGRVYAYDGEILVSMRWDGSDRREHLSVSRETGSSTQTADTILVSPNGRNALVTLEHQVWVVPLPVNGGPLLKVDLGAPAVPATRITDIGADYISWADRGETIAWGLGSTLFRRPLSSVSFRSSEDDKDDEREAGDGPIQYVALDEDESVERLEFAVTMPRSKPSGTIVLSGAHVIPMSGSTTLEMGSVLRDQDIVVTENRVVSISERGSRSYPAGAEVVDVSGNYIIPGLVDTHAHWEFLTHDVLQPHSWAPVANLAYGVTAGLDVQTSTKDYLAYWDMVEVGMSVGQRLFMVGEGIGASNNFKSYKATHAFLRRYKDHYRTHNIKSYLVGNRKQRQWIIQAAKDLALMPTTEAGGNVRLDLTHAIDGMHGNEHYYSEEAPQYDDVVQLYARTRIAFTPTFIVSGNPSGREYFFTRTEVHDDKKLARFNPHPWLDLTTRRRSVWARDDEFAFERLVDTAARLQRAGGLVGVGGHGEMQGLGVHWEMWIMAMGGMTNPEVLRAATIDGARIIGIDQDLGSIEEGKLADLVILQGNPLEEIRNTNTIRYVMKNGEFFNGDTLDQIWPEEKKLAPFWWWPEEER